MKYIFSLLLCYVLMTSQSYALSGGPVSGGSSPNPVGTYSGIFTPSDYTDMSIAPNALGLFSLSVVSTGLSSGNFLLYSNNATFIGTITASVDIDNGAILGVVQGAYTVIAGGVVFSNGTVGTITTQVASASGNLIGKVKRSKASSNSSARLGGSALIAVKNSPNAGSTLTEGSTPYVFNGFRQSLQAGAVTLPSAGSTTTGS